MTPEPLSALLDRSDAPALIVGEDGVTLTYAQLADRVEALARGLAGGRACGAVTGSP